MSQGCRPTSPTNPPKKTPSHASCHPPVTVSRGDFLAKTDCATRGCSSYTVPLSYRICSFWAQEFPGPKSVTVMEIIWNSIENLYLHWEVFCWHTHRSASAMCINSSGSTVLYLELEIHLPQKSVCLYRKRGKCCLISLPSGHLCSYIVLFCGINSPKSHECHSVGSCSRPWKWHISEIYSDQGHIS